MNAAPASTGAAGTTPRRRRSPEITVLRLLPWPSPLHRLWAGTKLLVVAGLALMVSIRPTWPALGVAAAVVALGTLVARVPPGAVPRLPRWIWVALAFSALLAARSGTAPLTHVAGVQVSLGGLGDWALLTLLAVVLLGGALLVGWTTPLGEVAPALGRLAAPARWLRLPVDEWIVAVGLAIRCLPLLIDETRTLVAVRRVRRRRVAVRPSSVRTTLRVVGYEAHDLLATLVVVALRRARDLADAMEARGGIRASTGPASGPRLADVVVLATLAVVVTATLVL
jgi:energy-coupling factor transporter transmembrane protein EcfT